MNHKPVDALGAILRGELVVVGDSQFGLFALKNLADQSIRALPARARELAKIRETGEAH